jgi:acetoin utilization deacetylase AcuC-like enzyme
MGQRLSVAPIYASQTPPREPAGFCYFNDVEFCVRGCRGRRAVATMIAAFSARVAYVG